jgi:hypothetical protein
LIADNVWRCVRERFETEHVDLLEVKGREQRVGAYRVLGRRRGTGRKQAPFVGRGEELALLELLWSNAEKQVIEVSAGNVLAFGDGTGCSDASDQPGLVIEEHAHWPARRHDD